MFILINDSPEEIYEKNKHLLCTKPEETIQAGEFMNEAVAHLDYHAKDLCKYKLCGRNHNFRMFLYKKKHQYHINIKKIEYKVYDSDKYNEIINELWDPDHPNFLNTGSVKIARVYTPNLVMIQNRYTSCCFGRQKYFYALATKVEISKDTTVIAMSSANINDHNPSNENYQNKIIKEANLFKTDIDSEDDIRKGKLKKTFVNIAGYLIKKCSKYVDITYIESVIDIQILII
ncbi:hypothetical protein YYC_02388 [Plasmodium yoelii 17X]|uniref:Fam-a protein n=1 Tax=Plasmodium yoelii 17X TaxID=1323249 RepID=V7PM08_PLAYE|nr:hypothetical protein YYC_02388 [Plasmodium yoelii 17X]